MVLMPLEVVTFVLFSGDFVKFKLALRPAAGPAVCMYQKITQNAGRSAQDHLKNFWRWR